MDDSFRTKLIYTWPKLSKDEEKKYIQEFMDSFKKKLNWVYAICISNPELLAVVAYIVWYKSYPEIMTTARNMQKLTNSYWYMLDGDFVLRLNNYISFSK